MAPYILGLCSVVFDVDVGNRIDTLVPDGVLSSEERMDVAFHSFPVRFQTARAEQATRGTPGTRAPSLLPFIASVLALCAAAPAGLDVVGAARTDLNPGQVCTSAAGIVRVGD